MEPLLPNNLFSNLPQMIGMVGQGPSLLLFLLVALREKPVTRWRACWTKSHVPHWNSSESVWESRALTGNNRWTDRLVLYTDSLHLTASPGHSRLFPTHRAVFKITGSCPTLFDPTRLLCPWDFLHKNTRVGCHLLLLGNFPTQGLSPYLLHLLHYKWILYHWDMQEALPTHYFTLFCFPQATHSPKYICHDWIQLTALAKPTRYLACLTSAKQWKSDPAISQVTSSPAGWTKVGPATGSLRAGDFSHYLRGPRDMSAANLFLLRPLRLKEECPQNTYQGVGSADQTKVTRVSSEIK